jgi:hypothetical protein
VVLGAAIVLGACGGGDRPPEVRQPRGDLEDQLGFNEAGITARESRVEASIRDCMRAQGFDYVPVDPFARQAAITGASRLTDEEFLQRFGYGISTLWGRGGAQPDPNRRVRARLAPPDRAAYDRALWGENKGATFQAAVDSGDFTKLGGCTRRGTENVFGGAMVLTRIQRKLARLDQRVLADQRMARALERWSSCMAAAGYRYRNPDAIDGQLTRQIEEVVGTVPGRFATGPPSGEKPKPYDHVALAALQREEIALARADLACEHRRITPVESVVRPPYEAQFRQRNQALIRQVKPVR